MKETYIAIPKKELEKVISRLTKHILIMEYSLEKGEFAEINMAI